MDIVLFFQSTFSKSWRQKLAGVHMYAQERGWFVQVVNRFTTPDEIKKALDEWRPVGCLVDRAMSNGAPPDRLFRGIPTVYLDQNPLQRSRRHPCLLHDSAAEAALAGGELLKLDCASYAYIGTSEHLHWDAERLAQFVKDARSRGHSVSILPYNGLKEAIAALPKPCGILGANDDCAIKAYHAATAAGFSVPHDVAIAGIDNDEIYCEAVSPGLTSAEPDFEGAGYRIAQMLAEEIERTKRRGKKRTSRPAAEKYGPVRLVRRGSTIKIPGIGPRTRRALEYIRKNACDRGISLDGVISQMNCSRRLATLLFKKETGHTILDEIHEQRFTKACHLLSRTKFPISAVVSQCGYLSASFVKKMFLKRTGLTMRNYRTLHSENRPSHI